MSKLFLYRKQKLKPYLDSVLAFCTGLNYMMSIVMVLALVYEHGFILAPDGKEILYELYDWVRYVFLANTTIHMLLEFGEVRKTYRTTNWVLQVLLYLTVIPAFLPYPTAIGWISFLGNVLGSYYYKVLILGVLSFMQLSNGIVMLLNRRMNQAFVFSISFLIIIFIGAGLLMLPRSTYNGLSFVDALFVSTSATCVTGLSTVDVVTTFTDMGWFIILVLIQIGGLGVMTLTCFFAMTFLRNASISSQVQVSDLLSSQSLTSLVKTMGYILGFTLIIEAVGAVLIWGSTHAQLGMTLEEEIKFALFHSISAFCNAGFSTLPGNLGNEQLMSGGNNVFYLVISSLIVLGGIGFPILVNMFENTKNRVYHLYKRCMHRTRTPMSRVHLYSINTRIALIMTVLLIVIGSVGIACLEWNRSFASLPLSEKVVQSIFTAVCPRTAGFNSFAISSFSVQSIMLIMLLMMIGGGTQSTAGGIKVNVFALIFLNLKAILFGTYRVTVFRRRLSDISVRSANSTLILYLCFLFAGVFVLSFFEPQADIMALLFECISALSTVGASLDLTSTLQSDSKIVIVILMFVGRVGVLTMVSSMIRKKSDAKILYPSDHIIIN